MPRNPAAVARLHLETSGSPSAETSPIKQCPVCSRASPAEAYYCYHDGTALTKDGPQKPLRVADFPFPMPFYFSDGQACATFNQLALACASHWEEAQALLADGIWTTWFRSIGRLDLATAATQAAVERDRDAGLSQLLGLLPADPEYLRPPKLALEAAEINLGQIAPGTDLGFDLVLFNQGLLLLRGSAWTSCDWLALGQRGESTQKMFQTRNVCTIPVQVLGNRLRAGLKPLEGEIVLDTNGGRISVPVKAIIPIRPFPRGSSGHNVLAGAMSPGALAQRAKAHPQEAALLFEQGVVKAWYASNGWTYPIEGSKVSGLGAVQQFFEALGLTRPPLLILDPVSLVFRGRIGERFATSLTIRTMETKPVYAQVWSNQAWIHCGPIKYLGNKVKILLEVVVPPHPGQVLQAQVTVRGNGNQVFALIAFLTVEPEEVSAATEPVVGDEQRLSQTIRKGVGDILRGFLGQQ